MKPLNLLYDMGLLAAMPFFLVKYARRGRVDKELLKRLRMPAAVRDQLRALPRRPLWIHAVSVGEVSLIKSFIFEWRRRYPAVPLVMSVVTPAGYECARTLYGEDLPLFYCPLDISSLVSGFSKVIDPLAFVAVETEIWPNLFTHMMRHRVPVLILNGRISDRSWPQYERWSFLFRDILRNVTCVCAQDHTARERFLKLGVADDRCQVAGNLKFRSAAVDENDLAAFSKRWAVLSRRMVLLAGSTHHPEEEIVLDAYLRLRSECRGLTLILCPRHVERARTLAEQVKERGLSCSFLSSGRYGAEDVFIIDKVGQLRLFYTLADIVFVGGSLLPHGGQNILEPAVVGRAILFGPYMQNFREIRDRFVAAGAAREVADGIAFYDTCRELLNDPGLRRELGERARQLTAEGDEAVDKSVEAVARAIGR
jgi:3-deoxy-D-manno-octulosonic-acid transferase